MEWIITLLWFIESINNECFNFETISITFISNRRYLWVHFNRWCVGGLGIVPMAVGWTCNGGIPPCYSIWYAKSVPHWIRESVQKLPFQPQPLEINPGCLAGLTQLRTRCKLLSVFAVRWALPLDVNHSLLFSLMLVLAVKVNAALLWMSWTWQNFKMHNLL